MLQKILESENNTVTAAGTVVEALALISQFRYDILISDLNMGHPADGFVVVSAMRKTHPEALTFILTGYPDFDSALEALRQHVNHYLVKATPVEELIAKIKSALAAGKSYDHPANTKRVPDIIESGKPWVVEQWLRRANACPELMRVNMSEAGRKDHVPALLEEAIAHARGDDVREERQKAAEQHGVLRYHQGYTVPMLILETRLLHEVISDCIRRDFLQIDLSNLVSDVARMLDTITKALGDSARAFMKQYEWNSSRPDRRSG